MSANVRIIARLDIKGPNVVKTVRSEGLRVIGDPKVLAEKYYAEGIDEMIYIDIVASLYERNLDFEQLRAVSEQLFIPLTVGGGIRSIHDIQEALRCGADKIAINTHALREPNFLSEAAHVFGSQCIVLSVEAKRRQSGGWEALTDGGREHSGRDVVEWITEGIERGAGEILLTSVDTDGTRAGYDLDLIQEVQAKASVPLIVHGGAGSPHDILSIVNSGVRAPSASSIFHYGLHFISDVKNTLQNSGYTIRP